METLQAAAKYWSILSMLGIFLSGLLLYGKRSGCMAATLYVLVSPITDSIDADYGAWMIAPYVWATAAMIWSVRSGRLGSIVLAGVLLAVAGLLKRQAAVLFPIFALVPLMGRWVIWPKDWVGIHQAKKAVAALFIGLGIGFAPIMLWYASKGALSTFINSYFFSESGWKYVKGDSDLWDQVLRVGDGFLGFPEYVATPTLLATVAIFMAVRIDKPWTGRGDFLASHLALSFIGAALGLRFFKGYYLQLLPALVWISAHPAGPISIWFRRDVWSGWKQSLRNSMLCFGALVITFPAALHDGMAVDDIRTRREKARDLTAQAIGTVIRENSNSEDRIWVWGRWAWPVYFHADRRPATDFPKTLSVFTSNLTNTWRRPTKNTGFIESPWPVLMEQLERDRPLFIVLSHNENYHKFKALRQFIRREYRAVRMQSRGFSVYRRKDHSVHVPDEFRRGRGKAKRAAKKKARRRRGRSGATRSSQPRKANALKTDQGLKRSPGPRKPTKTHSSPPGATQKKTKTQSP